jgi:hypothetical protein
MRTARWGAVGLVLVLAACGSDSDDEATAATTDTTVATTTAATTETTVATTAATVPSGPDDLAAWCSDLSGAVLALADVDDVDLPPEETVDRVDAVIAVARRGPGLEIPEITTLSETVTGTLPTAQTWIDAVNQLYDYCLTQVG